MISRYEAETIQAEMVAKVKALTATLDSWTRDNDWQNQIARCRIIHTARASTVAGRAVRDYRANECRITINVALCSDAERYRNTLAHEWAHILQYLFYPKAKGHSAEWRRLAAGLGDDGGRCHNYDVAAAFPERYVEFTCACGKGGHLGPRIAAKIRKGTATYGCKFCKRPIPPTI